MFPDSKIVESFALGAGKLRYLITQGITRYFYDLLVLLDVSMTYLKVMLAILTAILFYLMKVETEYLKLARWIFYLDIGII